MSWWPALVGAALVLFVLHDISHTLWHPTGRGPLTGAFMRTVWRLATMLPGRRPLELAGPLAMVLVVASWTLAVVLGYALVYWPHMPAGFSFAPPLDVSRRSSFLDSVYVSLVTLSTLGYGDACGTTRGSTVTRGSTRRSDRLQPRWSSTTAASHSVR